MLKALTGGIALAPLRLFAVFSAFTLLGVVWAVLEETLPYAALGMIVIVGYAAITNYAYLFWMIFPFIPLSIEYSFPNGLGTDLPVEPLIVGTMLAFLLYALGNRQALDTRITRHPLMTIIALHFVWILCTTLLSQHPILSIKYSLAKFWYIITFCLAAAHLLRSERDLSRMLWLVALPLTLITVRIIWIHRSYDFGFLEINWAVAPFFRNHVNYAALHALLFPMMLFALQRYQRFTVPWLTLIFCLIVSFTAIWFSYTRAAYLSLLLAGGAYMIIRLQGVRYVLMAALVGLFLVSAYFINDNRYLDYAPTERTIAHTDFNDIVSATSRLEDISTMERYHRWIAGAKMFQARPAIGFGPGSFYEAYKPYTVNRFKTYVSDNPERSTIHNYYLLMLVEQGIPGLLLFLGLCFATLLYGEWLYHQLQSRTLKSWVMGILLSTVVIDAFLIINDMIETDKVGSFFFLHIASLIAINIMRREEPTAGATAPSSPNT